MINLDKLDLDMETDFNKNKWDVNQSIYKLRFAEKMINFVPKKEIFNSPGDYQTLRYRKIEK